MAAWIRDKWENHLKYMAHNNPQGVLDIIAEDYPQYLDPSEQYSTQEVEILAFQIASQEAEDPAAFTKQLSDILPHVGNLPGWANIFNYSPN